MLRRFLNRLMGRHEAPAAPAPHPYRPPSPPPDPAGSEVQGRIRDIVQSQRVVLFMKGVPSAPQCGFSALSAGLLDSIGVKYQAIDVLTDDSIRQGIKSFANWPTIPQLYVDGTFVGGSDIMVELHDSGELAELLGGTGNTAAQAEETPKMSGIQQTSVKTVAQWLADGEEFVFLDVRTPGEYQFARVEGARLLTQDQLPELEQLPRDTRIAFLCHHGVRSQQAAMAFASMGFTDLHNVVGGIEAWSVEVDAGVPRY